MPKRSITDADHHCHAAGCTVHVPPEMLMCKFHWFQVPLPLRNRVWATYREGQCNDLSPSAEWHDAADRAVCAVADRTTPIPLHKHFKHFMETAADAYEFDGKEPLHND